MAAKSTDWPVRTSPAGVRVAVLTTGSLFAHVGGTLAPVSVNQSNVGVTVVVAAFDSA